LPDIQWDAYLHPKGHDGKFVHKGTGTFVAFGASKQVPHGIFDMEPGLTKYGSVVGGVQIHPPTGQHGVVKDIDYALHFGESAFKVTGTSSAVAVRHPDGSATLLKPTAPGSAPIMEGFNSLNDIAQGGQLTVAHHPFDVGPDTKAPIVYPVTGKTVTTESQLDTAPLNAVIHVHVQTQLAGVALASYRKEVGGWVNQNAQYPAKNSPSDFSNLIAHGQVHWGDQHETGIAADAEHEPEPPKFIVAHEPSEFEPGKAATSELQVLNAPVGTLIHFTSPNKTKKMVEYEKKEDGWYATANSQGKIQPGKKAADSFPQSTPMSVLAQGKLFYGPHPDAPVPVKPVKVAPTESDHMVAEAADTAVVAEPGFDKVLPAGHTIKDNALHHTLGETIPLPPGSSLHQHKKVLDSFALEHVDGTMQKITSSGKVTKAPDSLIAVLGTNYTKVHTVKTTIFVPGTNGVEIQTGQSLWASKGNPNMYAVVEDGKVVELLNKVDGEPAGKPASIFKNWQKAKGAGTLVHIFSAPDAAVSTGAGSVHTALTEKIAETPKVKAPKVETPKIETPKIETPEPELPKVEEPKVEEPKVEAPAEEVKKAAPKKKLKGALGLPDDLPKTFEFENGTAVLKPGSSLWSLSDEHQPDPLHGTVYSYLLLDATGKQHLLNAAGQESPTWMQPKGKKTVAQLLKASGYEPLAAGDEIKALEVPQGNKTLEFNTVAGLMAYAYGSSWSAGGVGSKLSDLLQEQPDGKVNQVYLQGVADALANVVEGKAQWNSMMTAAQKVRTTKSVKQLQAHLALAAMLAKVQSGEFLTPADFANVTKVQNDAAEVKTAALINHHNILRNVLVTEASHAKFAQGVEHLGWPVNSGTTAQYAQYATEHGGQYVAGMTHDQVKNWVLADLSAPDVPYQAKEIAETGGKLVLMSQAVSAKAEAVAAKKKIFKTVAKASEKQADLASKKLMVSYKQLANMHVAYVGPGDQSLTWSPQWGWSHWTGNQTTYMAPLQALELSKQDGWSSAGSPKIGNPVDMLAKELDESYPDWKFLEPATLAALGATNSAAMGKTARKLWIQAYLLGDEIGKFQAECLAVAKDSDHPLYATHPGSPASKEGQVAYQALSNWLAEQPWWHAKDAESASSAMSGGEKVEAATALGLMDTIEPLDLNSGEISSLLGRWVITHDKLPEPQTQDVQSAQYTLPGGESYTVEPGDHVLKSNHMTVHLKEHEFALSSMSNQATPAYSPYVASSESPNQAAALAYFSGLEWQDVTPVLAPLASTGAQLGILPKPANVSDHAWKLTLGAEEGGPDLAALIDDYATMDANTVKNQLSTNYGSVLSLDTRLQLLTAPDSVQRLAVWAMSASYYGQSGKPLATDVLAALTARAAAGEYIHPETTEIVYDGKTYTVPPGYELWHSEYYGKTFLASAAEGGTGFHFTTGGQVSGFLNANNVNTYKNANAKKVGESLASLDPSAAKSEGFNFTDDNWEMLKAADAVMSWTSPGSMDVAENAAAYSIKQDLAKQNLLDKYAKLPAQIPGLPVGVKAYLVSAAKAGDTNKLDAYVWKYGKGFYSQNPLIQNHPVVAKSSTYGALIGMGKVTPKAIEDWPIQAIHDYANDFNLPGLKTSDKEDAALEIAAHVKTLAVDAPTLAKAADPKKDTGKLELTWLRKKSEGMHGGDIYADQFGEEWMSKYFASDPNSAARVDAEHHANVIGKMLGFNQPQTFVRDIQAPHQSSPQYSYVQHLAPADGNLEGKGPKDLSEDQLAGAMSEHVLDWLLSNHDSHPSNLLRAPDGKTILGIDKGQAFVNYHQDKLVEGYKPNTNPVPVWYDKFYEAVRTGKIDQKTAERVAERVLLKAYQTQQAQDERFQTLMMTALSKRSNFPAKLPTAEKMTAFALERKHNLLKDFNTLYSDLWKKAGWEWTIDPDNFGKKVGEAHIQNGPQFAAEAADAKAIGLALMFNSRDLSGSHMMFTPMVQKTGGTTLLGAGRINTTADKALTAWLKSRVEGSLAHGTAAPAVTTEPDGTDMPLLAGMHSALVAYAKTVGQHAPNGGKTPDGEYNQTTISNATAQRDALQNAHDSVQASIDKDPSKLASTQTVKFQTLQQQDTWMLGAKQHLEEFKLIQEAHEANVPLLTVHPEIGKPPTGGLQPAPKYVPTADLGKHGAPDSEHWAKGDTLYVRTADGGHYTLAGGKKTWLSAQEYGLGIEGAEKQTVPGVPQEEKTVEVQVAGKQFKVTHANAAIHSGSIDFTDHVMKETKSGASSEFQQGYDYVVTHGNVTIRYRPHTESGVVKTQKGNLTFEIKDWDGSHGQIDDVLDTLNIMGVDVTPADQDSLELHYWRHMTEVLQQRAEKNQGKYQTALQKLQGLQGANKGMSGADELEALKSVWGDILGGKTAVDAVDYTPQFGTWYGKVGGRPSWIRPDADLEKLKKLYAHGSGGASGIQTVPYAAITHGSGQEAKAKNVVEILMSGGFLSSEERVRVLGALKGGMSSHGDQSGHGSSDVVFTRQNTGPWDYSGGPYAALVDPRAALATNNYSFAGDEWGDKTKMLSSPFEASKMYNYKGSNNELCIQDSAPVMYVACNSTSARSSVLAAAKEAGLTHFRGRPIEEMVLGPNDWQGKMSAIWDEVAAEEKEKESGH
jgi:hypothetical protein